MQLFFPTVIAAKASAAAQASSPYCQFDDMFLVLWTSSMFAAGKCLPLMHSCMSWPADSLCLTCTLLWAGTWDAFACQDGLNFNPGCVP